MSKKRVLMFGWEYPPHHSGGLGVACKGLAHALIDNEMHVCFVLPKTVTLTEKRFPVKFADMKSREQGKMSVHLETLARELGNPYLSHTEYEKRLQIFIQQGGKIVPRTLMEQVDHYGVLVPDLLSQNLGEFDVIHAHDWLCFPAGIIAKKITGKPLVVHIHATEFDRCGGNNVNQEVYNRERHGMHMADHIVTVSELTRKTVINNYGISPDKVTTVHNGSTTMDNEHAYESRFKNLYTLKQQGKKVVLFAGRITIQKGVDYFIKAAKKVLDYEPGVYFVVAGSGDMEKQMIDLTVELGISQNFLFTGYYKLEEQKDLWAAADVVVMPSVSEPFGIIPIESMAHGTPVIVSKQSGVAEVVTHALKVDFWDTDEMANQILSVIRHTVLRDTLSYEGLRQAKGITWDKAAKKLQHVYQTL